MWALGVMTEEEILIFWSTHTHTPSEHSQTQANNIHTHTREFKDNHIFYFVLIIIINYQLVGEQINGISIKIKMKPLKMT